MLVEEISFHIGPNGKQKSLYKLHVNVLSDILTAWEAPQIFNMVNSVWIGIHFSLRFELWPTFSQIFSCFQDRGVARKGALVRLGLGQKSE